jgi:hypothetical protein
LQCEQNVSTIRSYTAQLPCVTKERITDAFTGARRGIRQGQQPVLKLADVLQAWNTPAFGDVLKEAIANLDTATLPLQQGLSRGSYALDDRLGVSIISVTESADFIHVKAGIHYNSVIAGCSCADDPSPTGECTEYCEVGLDIDKQTAGTTVRLLRG